MPAKVVSRTLREAISLGQDVILRYDPGSRRPLQRLRVTPVALEEGLSATYLIASFGGGETTRRFSLNFVYGVELVAP